MFRSAVLCTNEEKLFSSIDERLRLGRWVAEGERVNKFNTRPNLGCKAKGEGGVGLGGASVCVWVCVCGGGGITWLHGMSQSE